MAPQQVSPQQLAQQNLMNRQILLANSINMWQPIYSQAVQGNPVGQVINIPLRNVGLVKRFVVEIAFSVTQGAAETQTRTKWGPANFLSQVVLSDLSNQVRISTAGWHLHALATAKRRWAFGSAYTNDSPVNIASNFPVIVAPSPVTTIQTGRMFFELPVTYGDTDLRGGIYANVVNATFNLQLTINPAFFVATGADPTLAAYQSSTAQLGVLSAVTITVHQNYLDQLPIANGGPVLPQLDLGTAYLINNSTVSALVANQDNPIPYANFRDFMSTFIVYDNFGSASAVGTDVNKISIQSANFTNLISYGPFMSSLITREFINDDFPAGTAMSTYYFDHRAKPISTIQYGNMQLVFTPAQVQAATSNLLVGYESLAYINQIVQAGSLYGN